MLNLLRRPASRAAAMALLACGAATAQITVYDDDNFQGRSFTTPVAVHNLQRRGLNDRASSAIVTGPQAWEVCDDADHGGRCRVLRPGQYPSLSAMGLNDRISSMRAVSRNLTPDPERYAPAPFVSGDYRRRGGERLFEAPVTSASAVYETRGRRCWIERDQLGDDRRDARLPGAVIGAVIGGILGHQIGGGSGRDLATAGGVVAGAVVGSRAGDRDDGRPGYGRATERCSRDDAASSTLAYWDVTYRFRGVEHRVQLAASPGPFVSVNHRGEPRG